MAANALRLPEIVGIVIDNVDMVPDLLNCACVNSTWHIEAMKKLYRGSLHDMQFRTPDIGSLSCLFVASRERFAQNMGHVKHLMLCPDTPTTNNPDQHGGKLLCFENCRALGSRKSAELFLKQGKGPASIIIPFRIVGRHHWALLDLLLSPTVKFLAIDCTYCELLVTRAVYSQEVYCPPPTFPNLKAISIYASHISRNSQDISQLLQRCALQFFHFEGSHEEDDLAPSNTKKFLQCLHQQKNLKALSISTCCYGIPLESPSVATNNKTKRLWPGLKALYITYAQECWLEQCPKFKDLQILSLKFPKDEGIGEKHLAKCRNLRAIDIDVTAFDSLDGLLDIARGCPLLRKFDVKETGWRTTSRLQESLFLSIARALPLLEVLNLGLTFLMNGAKLQELARYCPRLIVLGLSMTRLRLSLPLLRKALPFNQLETMRFHRVLFEEPEILMKGRRIEKIVKEWRRVFPMLRTNPCQFDIDEFFNEWMNEEFSEGDGSIWGDEEIDSDMSEDESAGYANENAGDTSVAQNGVRGASDADEDMSVAQNDASEESDVDIDEIVEDGLIDQDDLDPDSEMEETAPWHNPKDDDPALIHSRTKIWLRLDYQDSFPMHERIRNAWQASLEMATIGWPIMHSEMFKRRARYSTSAKEMF